MTIFWAGSEDSFALVLQAQDKLEKLQATEGLKAGYIEDLVAKLPPLWRHEGSTAVVSIQGPVVKGSAGWLRLFGVLGYDDIAKAATEAAMHEDTRTMLYHIESPGGDVAGIAEIGQVLGQLSAFKPSAVYTSEQMCSAGYWLASSLKDAHISVGPVAIVGSIGVLLVHSERSKMMENIGIKSTVLRSGAYKAEMNSIEPLTDEIKARALEQLADVHAMFRAQVAKGRPNLDAAQLAEVTEGQTFLGKKAVKAGLADQTQSFGQALKLLDKRKQPRNTSSNSTKATAMPLTEEQLAALAAGAPMASFGLKEDGTPMSAEEIAAYQASLEAGKGEAEKPNAEPAKTEPAKAAPSAADTAVVDLLKSQLAEANTKITELTVAAKANDGKLAAYDGLLGIAREKVGAMLIPIGGSKAAVEGMDGAAIVAEHARVQPLFLATFKAGRVSVPAAEDKKTQAAEVPAGFLAALKHAPSAKR